MIELVMLVLVARKRCCFLRFETLLLKVVDLRMCRMDDTVKLD